MGRAMRWKVCLALTQGQETIRHHPRSNQNVMEQIKLKKPTRKHTN